MTKKLTTRGPVTAAAIAAREPFTTSGALRGEEIVHPFVYPGRLNDEEAAQLRADLPGITYVVFSYATPIAWFHRDNGWHKVAQKFSMTTSHHQGVLYLIPVAVSQTV